MQIKSHGFWRFTWTAMSGRGYLSSLDENWTLLPREELRERSDTTVNPDIYSLLGQIFSLFKTSCWFEFQISWIHFLFPSFTHVWIIFPCNASSPINKWIKHEHMKLCIFVSNNDLNCFLTIIWKWSVSHKQWPRLGMDSMFCSRTLQQPGHIGCTGLRIESNWSPDILKP